MHLKMFKIILKNFVVISYCIFKEIAIFGVVAKDMTLLLRWTLLVEHYQSHLTKYFWLSSNSLSVLPKFSQNYPMKYHF